MQHRRRVLVVDDEPTISESLCRILNLEGFEAVTAGSGEAAVALAATFHPDFAVLEVILNGLNGIDAASTIVFQRPSCRVILISGHPATSELIANGRTPLEVLAKPVSPELLLQRLRES